MTSFTTFVARYIKHFSFSFAFMIKSLFFWSTFIKVTLFLILLIRIFIIILIIFVRFIPNNFFFFLFIFIRSSKIESELVTEFTHLVFFRKFLFFKLISKLNIITQVLYPKICPPISQNNSHLHSQGFHKG